MKLVYATDLHGDGDCYRALAKLAFHERVEVLILGGDWFAYSPSAAPQLAFAEGPLYRFLHELRQASIEVLAIHGNVDRPAAIARMRQFEDAGLVHLLGTEVYEWEDPADHRDAVSMIGYSFVPPTPFRLKDHERRDLSADRLGGRGPILIAPAAAAAEVVRVDEDYLDRLPSIEEDLAALPDSRQPCLLVSHSPPWEVLDMTCTGLHAGSRAIRRWIEDRQPILALHGHIHEGADLAGTWARRLGRSICINPGAASAGRLHAVVGDTGDLPGSLWHTRYGRCPL